MGAGEWGSDSLFSIKYKLGGGGGGELILYLV